MRWTSTPPPEHAEAVSRRMAALSAELAAVRSEHPIAGPGPESAPVVEPAQQPAQQSAQQSAQQPVEQPVEVRAPGRHASRRGRAGLGRRLPAGLPPALRLSGAHLAVLALVLGVALAVTAWVVLAGRARPEPLPEVAPAAGSLVPSQASAPARPAKADLVVDVAGKVLRPGIVELAPGSRVVDALEAAGGARRGVSLTSLNLARPVVDGEQILVGVAAPGPVGAAAAQGAGTAGPPVNLNTADMTTLETLPGVGPVTAQAILDWRTEHGGFTAVEELLEVDGIGDATLDEIAPHVTI